MINAYALKKRVKPVLHTFVHRYFWTEIVSWRHELLTISVQNNMCMDVCAKQRACKLHYLQKKKKRKEKKRTDALYEFIEWLQTVVQKCYRIKAPYNVLYFSVRIIKMDIFNLWKTSSSKGAPYVFLPISNKLFS